MVRGGTHQFRAKRQSIPDSQQLPVASPRGWRALIGATRQVRLHENRTTLQSPDISLPRLWPWLRHADHCNVSNVTALRPNPVK